ncbi:integrin beta-PS [Trichonephila clavata]|uniref:Integrin beta n=1 Tax=Trichonephila clavata TaxID=2740835 RepID=A0A8X6GSQ1_TRICU|nr:integrin beta-PS [Trichonephila clavata]
MLLHWLVTFILIPVIICEDATPCSSRLTCGACLASHNCAWCSDKIYQRGAPRCDKMDNLLERGCSKENIFSPGTISEILENEPLSDAGAVAGSAIQLKPQKLKLSLRPGDPTTFKVTFRQAEDYPVDLYYLMDLTFTMKKHKETLAELADTIAESMNNVTKNFRLGFGSFIDKVVMPYVDMVPDRLRNPCRDIYCNSPYGFRNHLSLNDDVTLFTKEVSRANLSGNLDNAEGGFDAIMQVIVCKEKIKWNERSRKIILFATDGIFHYAGDGKLGGIVKPNDGSCHLDDDGYYTESIYQDYPSLSQINNKIIENKILIIFAVPDTELPLYQRLTTHVEGTYAEKLESDASNIVDLIQQQYNKIQSKVELKDTAPDFVKVSYSSSCLGEDVKDVNYCEGLKVGGTVDFNVKVELLDCPKNMSLWSHKVQISPVGLNEYISLDVDLLCECDCEKPEYEELLSPECSNAGTFACGICNCESNYFGRKCECQGDDVVKEDKLSLCKKEENSTLCSGRGDCVCGVCDCYAGPSTESKIYGEFCECDTFSCERDSNGLVCGGEERGMCCGECICNPGWTGSACECRSNIDTCIAPGDQETGRFCSGRGECVCGECQCYRDDERGYFGGPYCGDCSFQTCEGRCTEFRDCVQCKAFDTSLLSEEECQNCTIVPELVDDVDDISQNERKCIFKDEEDCSFTFVYGYDDNNKPVIRVLKTRECPSKEPVLWIALGVTAGVFLIGLIALLIGRFVIYLKDKRDCERFLEEVNKNTQWGNETNPIYKEAISEYPNPIYGQTH